MGSITEQVVEATVAATDVGASLDVIVTAVAEDDRDRASDPPASIRRTVYDPRRPPPVTTAPRILWCSQPDATGRSELALRWPADDHTRFRVFLADERRLAALLGLAVDESELRAQRARRIWERSRELADRSAFTLLTEQPLIPLQGQVVYRQQVPGSLRGVQFVRVVPVSAGGVEATFSACPLVPVAVPALDAPPPPALRVAPEPGDRIRVEVEAHGLVGEVAGARGGAPRFRIKRTRGGADEALYMPPLFEGDLVESNGVWRGSWVDGTTDPLAPFVRHIYVAEVRYPPEPDLGRGPAAAPATITAAWEDDPRAAPSAWSAASVPASTAIVPPDPPAPPSGVAYTLDASGGATITIPAPLPAHPTIRPFWALVVRESATGVVEALPPVALTDAPTTIHDATAGSGYRVALIDPLGRLGAAAAAVRQP